MNRLDNDTLKDTLVYSTDPKVPSRPQKPQDAGISVPQNAKKSVRLSLEKKGRGGKTVTIVAGLATTEKEAADWATRLKKGCGTGGTHKETTVEIQGDHRSTIAAKLRALGHEVKGD